MADHKNQHYVPKCALKPFSLNGEGAAINVFNLAQRRAIQNAPVKGQCSRDYFYGKDLSAEKQLAELEGEYAAITAKLEQGSSLDDADREWLHLFVMVQVRRTEAAIEQIREFHNKMADEAFKKHPEQRPAPHSEFDLVVFSMKSGLEMSRFANDLKLFIFRNKTVNRFVISDNPAMLTNRYYLQRLKRSDFGFASSGTLISLPLSPRLSALWYDTGVYTIPNGTGTSFIDVTNSHDITAINQLQYLNAAKNVYFSNFIDRTYIGSEIDGILKNRAVTRVAATTFVRDTSVTDYESYRRGTPDEEQAAKEIFIATRALNPNPSSWPTLIKFRSKPITFSNGSAVGYVRKPEWLSGNP